MFCIEGLIDSEGKYEVVTSAQGRWSTGRVMAAVRKM